LFGRGNHCLFANGSEVNQVQGFDLEKNGSFFSTIASGISLSSIAIGFIFSSIAVGFSQRS